jgi:hypothetical protein
LNFALPNTPPPPNLIDFKSSTVQVQPNPLAPLMPPLDPLRTVCLNRISVMTMPPAATLSPLCLYLFLRSAAVAASAIACKRAAAASRRISLNTRFVSRLRPTCRRASCVLQVMGSDWSKLCKVGQPAPAAARALARTNASPSSARLNARCMKGRAVRGDAHAAATLLTFIQDSIANAGATRPLAIGCVCADR